MNVKRWCVIAKMEQVCSKRDPPDICASNLDSNLLVVQDEHTEPKPFESLVDYEQEAATRSMMGGKTYIHHSNASDGVL